MNSKTIKTRIQLFEFCEWLLKDEEALKQRDAIYADLLSLPKGYQFEIGKSWKETDIDLRMKICCLFITENMGYSFSEDYKYIRRND